MNSSNLTTTTPSSIKIYTSIYSLSVPIQDIVNVYVLSVISLVGSITNLMSLAVLVKCYLKTSSKMYSFLILATVANFVKLSTSVPLCIFRCGSICSNGYNYHSKVYELYIYLFIGNSAKVYVILVWISSSLDRLVSFYPDLMRKYEKIVSLKYVFAFWFFLAFAVNYPDYILTRNVTQIGKLAIKNELKNVTEYQSLYSVTSNSIGQLASMKLILYVLNVLRRFAILVVLLIINLIVGIKFSKHLKNKRKITVRSYSKSIQEASIDASSSTANKFTTNNSSVATSRKSSASTKSKLEKSENLVNKTILIVSVACFFGNIVDSFSAIMFFSLPTETYNNFLLISNFLLFAFYTIDPLLIYLFNEKYRHQFNKFYLISKLFDE